MPVGEEKAAVIACQMLGAFSGDALQMRRVPGMVRLWKRTLLI